MDGHLTEPQKEYIRNLYKDRVATYGRDVKTVGWGSKADQLRRFRVLTHGLDLRGKRIMDVGCGLGDMVPFLHELTGGDFTYLGVDISPELIREASAAQGGPGREFVVQDLLAEHDLGQVDVSLVSGALSIRIDDNMPFVRAMILRMFEMSREAVAVNFLSTYVDYQLDKDFHCSPEEIFAYAKSLTRWVSLYHDYPLWEFTLQLRKAPRDTY